MSIYVFYSDLAAEKVKIFWCTVKVSSSEGPVSEAVVPVTHTFLHRTIPDSYDSLKLEYKGEFVSYATYLDYVEFQKKTKPR